MCNQGGYKNYIQMCIQVQVHVCTQQKLTLRSVLAILYCWSHVTTDILKILMCGQNFVTLGIDRLLFPCDIPRCARAYISVYLLIIFSKF